MLFDDTNLYIATRAWDSVPESEWVVNEMRRDSFNVLQNDNLGFLIDTFYDRRNGIIFTINPIGGRRDGEAKTQTTGRSGQDTSYKSAFRYNGDRYGVTAEHLFVDAAFSPGVGFVRREDFRKSSGSLPSGRVETREAQGRFEIEFESTRSAPAMFVSALVQLQLEQQRLEQQHPPALGVSAG